jgi:two-component sensor histidine kinase
MVLVSSLWIVIPLLVIAIGAILWSWSLRRQVASRTAALCDEISRRSAAESLLKASLHDKDVLLRELHHRVKNNMQVICGLLSMQSAEIDDESVVSQLSDTQYRIRAIALVHEKLYQCEGLAEVDLKAYVEDLTARLMSNDLSRGRLSTKLHADPVSLPIEKAIPCGLILNELIGNCLKHAFPDDRSGRIVVKLGRTEAGDIEVGVRDDGVGSSRMKHQITTESMGLRLVRDLAEKQLRGRFELLYQDPGIEVRVSFPEDARSTSGKHQDSNRRG